MRNRDGAPNPSSHILTHPHTSSWQVILILPRPSSHIQHTSSYFFMVRNPHPSSSFLTHPHTTSYFFFFFCIKWSCTTRGSHALLKAHRVTNLPCLLLHGRESKRYKFSVNAACGWGGHFGPSFIRLFTILAASAGSGGPQGGGCSISQSSHKCLMFSLKLCLTKEYSSGPWRYRDCEKFT